MCFSLYCFHMARRISCRNLYEYITQPKGEFMKITEQNFIKEIKAGQKLLIKRGFPLPQVEKLLENTAGENILYITDTLTTSEKMDTVEKQIEYNADAMVFISGKTASSGGIEQADDYNLVSTMEIQYSVDGKEIITRSIHDGQGRMEVSTIENGNVNDQA